MKKKLKGITSYLKGLFTSKRQSLKTIILCVIIVIVSVVPAVFINNIYGYLPVFTLILVTLISWIYLVVLGKSLVYEDKSQVNSCRRSESMDFCLRVENKSWLVYPQAEVYFYMSDLFGRSDSVTKTVITLAPREKRDFVFDVRFEHLGSYTVGLEHVEVRGLLGIKSKSLPGGASHVVEVWPRIWKPEDLHISENVQSEDNRAHVNVNIEGGDYTGVREYVMGDPIKNIHWKLSAHADGYLTKQTETFGSSGVEVLIDLCGPQCDSEMAMSLFDALVESAVSICNYVVEKGMECDIAYLGRDAAERSHNAAQADFYHTVISELPHITSDPDEYNVMPLIERFDRSLYAKNNIVLCTSLLTAEIVKSLVNIWMHKRNPILVFVIPDNLTDKEREERQEPLSLLEERGISYYVISSAAELQ